jgi:hypothetical protein
VSSTSCYSAAVEFTKRRDALQSNIKTHTQPDAGTSRGGLTQPASDDSTGSPHEASSDLVSAIKRRSADVKALTSFEERIEDQKKLAETYIKWLDVISRLTRANQTLPFIRTSNILHVRSIAVGQTKILQQVLHMALFESKED